LRAGREAGVSGVCGRSGPARCAIGGSLCCDGIVAVVTGPRYLEDSPYPLRAHDVEFGSGLLPNFLHRSDDEHSDVDVLVALHDPGVDRLAGLAERLSRSIGREMQLVRLSDAQSSPVLMVDVIDHGRVLIDRDDLWSGLGDAAPKWRRLARSAERSSSAALDEHDLDHRAV